MRAEKRPIPDMPGYYANSDGYISRDDPNAPGCFIGLSETQAGTNETTYVYINGKRHTVASLVAKTFIPNDIGENAVVFHLDGHADNNHIDNLIWVTPGERRQLTSKTNLPQLYLAYLKEIRENA